MRKIVFDRKTFQVLYEFDGSADQLKADLPAKADFFETDLVARALYVKHTDQGWQFDPDRKPDPPELGAIWEHPRWVTVAEQRARHNIYVQAQIDLLERKQFRSLRELVLPGGQSALEQAVKRMTEIEEGIAALRAQWWHADMAAPPVQPHPVEQPTGANNV